MSTLNEASRISERLVKDYYDRFHAQSKTLAEAYVGIHMKKVTLTMYEYEGNMVKMTL